MIKLIKKLPFVRRYSTKSNIKGWKNRKIDWEKEYTSTWNHPHRHFIASKIRDTKAMSVFEVGCGGGANLYLIAHGLGLKVGGCDLTQEAVLSSAKHTPGEYRICKGDNVLASDKSTDILLTDMTLIYVGPFKIKKYLKEFSRVCRGYIFLLEFDEPRFWQRQKERFNGHHAHDYKRLLKKMGYYDIMKIEIPPECYPEGRVGNRKLIVARPPIVE